MTGAGAGVCRHYREVISKLLEHSTAHGMERIGAGPEKRSMFWIVTFALSVVMVSTQCSSVIGQYLNYGKIISIELNDQKVDTYPFITVCSEFFVSPDVKPHDYYVKATDQAKNDLAFQQELREKRLLLKEQYDTEYFSKWSQLPEGSPEVTEWMAAWQSKFDDLNRQYSDDDTTFRHFYDKLQLTGPHKAQHVSNIRVKDFIFDCKFQNLPCNYENFVARSSDYYGNCFTFQSPPLRSTTDPEYRILHPYDAGLSFKVRLPESRSKSSRAATKGIRISVHEPNTLHSFSEGQGLFTSLGVDAYVQFSKKVITRFSNNRESCCSEWPLEGERFKSLAYNDKVCRKLCAEQSLVSQCGCYISSLYGSVYPEAEKCGLDHHPDQSDCLENANTEMKESDECDEICCLPCSEVEYVLKLWYSRYPHLSSMMPELLKMVREPAAEPSIKADALSLLDALTRHVPHSRLVCPPGAHNYTAVQRLACIVKSDPANWAHNIISTHHAFATLHKIRASYATVHVTESAQDHQMQQERPEVEFASLLAEIGGVLGLWVGISIITLVEFFEILTISARFFWNHFIQRRKTLEKQLKLSIKTEINSSSSNDHDQPITIVNNYAEARPKHKSL